MKAPGQPTSDEYFACSIGAAVPQPFAEAVYVAVRASGLTLADYVRGALSEKLARDGVSHRSPPRLARTTYLHGRKVG